VGLFLGIAVALIVEVNSHSFNNREDIRKNLQLKALASIPELKERGFELNKLIKIFSP
jgi:capsular polysaccharide biosynthesis protein